MSVREGLLSLLAEGDPLFYSSYMHMHTRLTERFDAVILATSSVEAARLTRALAPDWSALTGAFDRIDFRSTGGQGLKDKWKREGLQTFLGVEVPGFPNMFMLMGPHTALGNIPRSIEHNVEWVTGLIKHMRERKLTLPLLLAMGRDSTLRARVEAGDDVAGLCASVRVLVRSSALCRCCRRRISRRWPYSPFKFRVWPGRRHRR